MILRRRTRRFALEERASATVEFAILMPVFILILLSTFEMGMLMTRHTMLDRGLDLAVRQVRLGTLANASHEQLVAAICAGIPVMRNCTRDLRLEMRRVTPRAPALDDAPPTCVNRDDPGAPPPSSVMGGRNELILLRACALFDPMFPATGLGASLPRQSGGAYALIATSSYVIEPI